MIKLSRMKMVKYMFVLCAVFLFLQTAYGQKRDSIPANDTIPSFIKGSTPSIHPKAGPKDSPYETDSVTRKKHDPRKATLYSTFLPGMGQFYNKKYWKLPLVAAALGIPAYTYFYNKKEYNKAQFAIGVISAYFDTAISGTPTIPPATLAKVDPRMQSFVVAGQANNLRAYRNYVRKNEDYSVLIFMLFWGLQIVDATVDAHLKEFDVSDKLALRLEPVEGSQGGIAGGVGLVFDLHAARFRAIPLP